MGRLLPCGVRYLFILAGFPEWGSAESGEPVLGVGGKRVGVVESGSGAFPLILGRWGRGYFTLFLGSLVNAARKRHFYWGDSSSSPVRNSEAGISQGVCKNL